MVLLHFLALDITYQHRYTFNYFHEMTIKNLMLYLSGFYVKNEYRIANWLFILYILPMIKHMCKKLGNQSINQKYSSSLISWTENMLPKPKLRQNLTLASAEAEASAKVPKLRHAEAEAEASAHP